MRGKVTGALKSLRAFAVENPCLPGTPDVAYIDGWLELKWLREWPKRDDSPVTIEHYTPQQRVFHIEHWRHGGAVFLLLQVRGTWLLFDGPTAARIVGRVTRAELHDAALVTWSSESEMRANLPDAVKQHSPR
jgi:hypothetical protein